MNTFKKTARQVEAVKLLASAAIYILLFGGSRSGKTFIILFAIIVRAVKAPGSRHAVIRLHFNAVKQSIGLDTLPKVFQLCFPQLPYQLNKSDWCITLPNGSEIWLLGLDDKDRVDKILGKEFATIYFNESSELSWDAVETAITRLAQNCPEINNKIFFDCNPPSKVHWSYVLFIEKLHPVERTPLLHPGNYASMIMNPLDNVDNLPEGYIDEHLAGLSERKRQRFLLGIWLDDVEGALWTRDIINKYRVVNAPDLVRVVVGVDPAVTAKENSDYTGIVSAGIAKDGHVYVLADATIKGTPYEWAKVAIDEYRRWRADRVIGEVNNGGDLIEMNLRNVDRNVSYRSVRASRGKFTRAEPVAALYEQGKVHHVRSFTELEDQMCSYNPETAIDSPDRMDALVWAIAELMKHSGASRVILA